MPSFAAIITVLAGEGRPNRSCMNGAIEFTKKSPDVTANISPEQVFDFSFVDTVGR